MKTQLKKSFLLILIGMFLLVGVNALQITVNSPAPDKSYPEDSVQINLTTDIPATCKYDYWFPYSFGLENQTGFSMWFGTNYENITTIPSLEHAIIINSKGLKHLGFECTGEDGETKTLAKIPMNTFKEIPVVPEFSFYIGALTLLSAVGIFFFVRKR